MDSTKTPAKIRYRLVAYSIADTPAPLYSREPNLELMVRLMGCTQVETITGPIRASTCPISWERRSRPGRYRKPFRCRAGTCTAAWRNQPSRNAPARPQMPKRPFRVQKYSMMTRLDTVLIKAGTLNSPSDCKIPTNENAAPVKSTVGNMIRVSSAARAAVGAS